MGLLKTGLKAAVAVKTADVIHERVLARQQEHAVAQGHPAPAPAVAQPESAEPIAAAPAAAAPDMGDKLAQLKQLGELHEQGVLTDEEFATQKQRVLAG